MHVFDDIIKFAITILSTTNPLGAIPVFLSMTHGSNNDDIKQISNSCSIAVMVTLGVSLIIGQKILSFFGISIASFRIGGGLLLFTMAFSMISAKQNESKMNEKEIQAYGNANELGVVPLAIPLLSGPAAISTSIIHAQEFSSTYHWVGAFIVIAFFGLLIKLTLSFSRRIRKKLGTIGLNVMTRIMGLILLALSVEMVASGIKKILPVLSAF